MGILMINRLFFTIIIFGLMQNTFGMYGPPPLKDQTLLNAFMGFEEASVIPCKTDPTLVLAQFANQEDLKEKRDLLTEFRQEMERESDLFNKALQYFQRTLLRIPPEKNNDEKYFAALIEEKITEIKRNIDVLYGNTNHYSNLMTSQSLTIAQKREALGYLRENILNMHRYIQAHEELEVIRTIFNRIECKRNLQDIALLEESLSMEELIGRSRAQVISAASPCEEASPMSISPPESRALGMSGYLDWLSKDIAEKQSKFPYRPIVSPPSNEIHRDKPKPTDAIAHDLHFLNKSHSPNTQQKASSRSSVI